MDDLARIERIMDMEAALDRLTLTLRQLEEALDALDTADPDVQALSAYYDLGGWREDYEADEAGRLPASLKRGVLSEDALYDLLGTYDALLLRMGKKASSAAPPDEV